MAKATQAQVLESALRWSDGRRIFMGESPEPGRMLFRMEMEPLAVDEAVLQKVDELQAACVAALEASRRRLNLTLHKAAS